MKIKKYRKWKRIDRWLQTAIIAMSIIVVGTFVTAQTISVLTLGRLQIGNNITVLTPAQFLFPDGTALLPGSAFASDPTTGIYGGGGIVRFSSGGVQSAAIWSGNIAIYNNAALISMGTGQDLYFGRDAADIFAQKRGNFDQVHRLYGANNAYFQVATQSELLTILAAATTDTAMTIPANAIVRGVAVYVVTVIPAPAVTFTVTGTASGTVFNTAAVGVAAGSNDVGTQNTPYKNGAAQTIRITPSAIPGAATGQVRIVLIYEIPSPPTS